DVSLFYDRSADRLTDLFYKGDRSMRESGFDPSNRFGPFSADIIHYTPVCLNVLLYRMEEEASRIQSRLGDAAAASDWRAGGRALSGAGTASAVFSGTPTRACTSTTTSKPDSAGVTNSRRRSIRCGRASRHPTRRAAWRPT